MTLSSSAAPLVGFYRGDPDDAGRTLELILSWDDETLEDCHDYIQWLFPLTERSAANPAAPTLTPEEIDAFRSEPELRSGLLRSFRRMLAFYGLEVEQEETPEPTVRVSASFREQGIWLSRPHNFLRLTRILRSLCLLGLPAHARALFGALSHIYDEHRGRIGERTYGYWIAAVADR
jgi:hypothetical protein